MSLRVAKNVIEVVGVLKEVDLEKVDEMNDKGEKIERIKGVLKIKVKEDEIPLSVNVNRYTKSGTEAKNYTKLSQMITGELPSMAKDPENPTIVSIRGSKDFTPQIRENRYYNSNTDQAVARLGYSLGFGNINIDNSITEDQFRATYSIEGFIKNVKPEIKIIDGEEEETGRAIVDILVPAYSKEATTVFPMTLVAGVVPVYDPKTGDYIEDVNMGEAVLDEIEPGDCYAFQGDIVNRRVVVRTVTQGLGRARIDEEETVTKEYTIVGGQILDNETNMFDEDAIRTASKERTINLQNIEEEGRAKANSGTSRKPGLSGKSNNGSTEVKEKKSRTFDF